MFIRHQLSSKNFSFYVLMQKNYLHAIICNKMHPYRIIRQLENKLHIFRGNTLITN